jgi:hypothetical protein
VTRKLANVSGVHRRARFSATGAMNYPEGEMKFIWDGRGTRGPSASCRFTDEEIRMSPIKVFRTLLGWPELVLPRQEIELVEQLFLGRYRFRVTDHLLDGACFRSTGDAARREFLAGLEAWQIPIVQIDRREKFRFERRTLWNQVRWGGRLRRRHQRTAD